MWVLSWGCLVTPKFSAPPSGETMPQTPKCFLGARTCSRSSIIMPTLVGLGFHPPPGWPKTLSFLSVCLSVRHAFERQSLCARFRHEGLGVQKRFWSRWGRFVVVHPCSTLWDWCQLTTSLNAEVQKLQKRQKLGFSPPHYHRINRWRRNFAGKRRPWVCYSTPNLALAGKRGSVQEPQKCQNLPKIVVFGHRKPTQWTHLDEIWSVSVDFGSAVSSR